MYFKAWFKLVSCVHTHFLPDINSSNKTLLSGILIVIIVIRLFLKNAPADKEHLKLASYSGLREIMISVHLFTDIIYLYLN